MSSSFSLTRRIVHWRLPIWFKASARALPPLALIGILLASGRAESFKLKLQTTWPGQYDTLIGNKPAGGNLPLCAPFADPTIAVGGTTYSDPIHVAADWNYGIFHPNGVTPFQEALSSFFDTLLPNQKFVVESSPKLLFDGKAQRFVLVTAANTLNNAPVPQQSWITIGASTTNDFPAPNPSDCTYRIDANLQPNSAPTNFYADNVRLGITADSMVITANMYGFNDNAFQYSKLWVIRKSDIYNASLHGCPTFNPTPSLIRSGFKMPNGSTAQHVVPAKSYDANSSVTYLASAWGAHGSELALWTLDTQQLALSSGITGTSVPTKPYSSPPNAVQKGTTTQIVTSFAELTNAVYQPRTGLWTVHTVTCPEDAARSCFDWYQIDPQAGTVIQDSSFGYSDASVYAPSVAVDRLGDAVFAFNYSGPNYYVGVNVIGRDAIDPLNKLQKPGIGVVSGVAPYVRPTATWAPGLTTSIDTDPADDGRFWMIGAYSSGTPTFDGNGLGCKATGQPINGQVVDDWTTQVGAVSISEPPGAPNDFNGDDYSDILWQNDSGEVVIWEMNGLKAIASASISNPGPSWHIKGTGDFNGDSFSDILWQNDSGEVAIWEMNGFRVIASASLGNPGPSWHIKGTGDFNGDGFSDILWQNDTGEVAIWELNGFKVIGAASLGNPGPSWHIEGTGDFNNDGFSDILWQNDSGEVVIWEMNGFTVIGSASLGNPGRSWHAITTGDFNGDGFSDILWQNDSGEVVIWEMNGLTVIGSANLGNPGPSWRPVRTANFDAKPYSDILWRNDSGEVVIWLMKGTSINASASLGNPGQSWHPIGP